MNEYSLAKVQDIYLSSLYQPTEYNLLPFSELGCISTSDITSDIISDICHLPNFSLSSLSKSFAFVANRFQDDLRMSGPFQTFSKCCSGDFIIFAPLTSIPASWFLFPLARLPMAALVMLAEPMYARSSSNMNIFIWLCSLYRNSKRELSRS